MSCRTYDPCLDSKLNQIGSYASVARQSAQSATASAEEAQQILDEIKSIGMPTGGGSDKVFYLNGNQVTVDYTIPTGKNAMSAGPITVVPPAVVTVPPGQSWTIV